MGYIINSRSAAVPENFAWNHGDEGNLNRHFLLHRTTFVLVRLLVTLRGVALSFSPFSPRMYSGWIQLMDVVALSISLIVLNKFLIFSDIIQNQRFPAGSAWRWLAKIHAMDAVRRVINYGKNVLTNRQYFWHLFWLILTGEFILGCLIIHFVPCKISEWIYLPTRHGNRLEGVHGPYAHSNLQNTGLHKIHGRNGTSCLSRRVCLCVWFSLQNNQWRREHPSRYSNVPCCNM